MSDERRVPLLPTAESILGDLMRAGDSSLPSMSALRSALDRLAPDEEPAEGAADEATYFGRYRLEEELGRGGAGWVFLAVDRTLNRPVALKVPRPELVASEAVRQLWLHEATAAGRLDHPHIVPVYEAGQVDSLSYIVSAYCPGGTLADWLERHGGRVRPRSAARLVASLADAVSHAHERGILHCDIKPANVLLQFESQSSDRLSKAVAKLADFGLARWMQRPTSTTAGSVPIGTPRYMAPEQAAADERAVGVGTDIHALGVLLFELLTGEPPFAGADRGEMLERIRQEPVSGDRLGAQGVPRDLQAICLKCLAKTPSSRYRSAMELREDLERFLEHRPVSARRLGALARSARWCRRRPALAASLALAAFLGVWGAAGISWYARQADGLAEESTRHELAAQVYADDAARLFNEAQQVLLDLGWVAQESTVWIDQPDGFRAAVRDQVGRRYQQLIAVASESPDPTLRAGAFSVEAAQAS